MVSARLTHFIYYGMKSDCVHQNIFVSCVCIHYLTWMNGVTGCDKAAGGEDVVEAGVEVTL